MAENRSLSLTRGPSTTVAAPEGDAVRASAEDPLGPVRGFNQPLSGFFHPEGHPDRHFEGHYVCRGLRDEVTQCLVFDGTQTTANLVAIEYVISERLFAVLPVEEKRYWHPHNYEILSGQWVVPTGSEHDEQLAMARKINSYGKTWLLWDSHHFDGQSGVRTPGHGLPVGAPELAWSDADEESSSAKLIESRDQRLGVSNPHKRALRRELASIARPQYRSDAPDAFDSMPTESTSSTGAAPPIDAEPQGARVVAAASTP